MSEDKEQQKIKKIREYVLKSGFPSEIEVGNILRKRGWLVVNQLPYTCPADGGKIRTVDVSATKFGLPLPMGSISLIIECKKSQQHDWVFHTQQKMGELFPALVTIAELLRNLQKPPFADKLKELAAIDNLSLLLGGQASLVNTYIDRLSGLHVMDKNIKIGILHVAPSSRDDFFEATQQINSAIESMGESMKTSITFPVIVFDGELYEFYQEDNEIRVLPTDHIQFMSFAKGRQAILIDVVRKSYFSDFLTLIERDFNILKDFAEAEAAGLGNQK